MITEREPGDIISEVLMTLAADPETIFWLLEGISDVKFFRSRLKSGICLVDSTGKYKVISTMQRINADRRLAEIKLLGIVDNDYDWLTEYRLPENIISTEPRDLEGVMLRANSVACVLAEYGNAEAVVRFERGGVSIVEAVIQRSLLFGKIRAVNNLNEKVCLKKFKPLQFFKEDWSYDEESALERAVQLGVAPNAEILREKIRDLPSVSDWYYIRGHDAIDILCGGLKSLFGDGRSVGIPAIEPILRQSLNDEDFARSKIFTEVVQWHQDRGLGSPYIYSPR
ncbi:DUF4435 domain-containing protein [Pseudomonas sp. IT-P4]|uniref:DUF4435 domain-containing protein n=1 Tax=Pseudomonas sp. IT-P4 TaxID=3026446 RepID=UPI0039DF7ED6